MIQYYINRDIQNQPKFWNFEGIFLFAMLGLTVLVMLITILVSAWTGKIILFILGIASIIILRYYSQKLGVRGLKRKIGDMQQPPVIISTNAKFQFLPKGTNNSK